MGSFFARKHARGDRLGRVVPRSLVGTPLAGHSVGRMARYDEALVELHGVPLGRFVEERKRLAAELSAAGDKGGATLLAKHTKPSASVWAVNQLYRSARDDFDELFATAARVRRGELEAAAEHRKVTTKLTSRAATVLTDAGHGASEATLRRVSATLSALGAAGGFEPDPPGALATDRDPPGFDAIGLEALPDRPRPPAKSDKKSEASAEETREARAAAAAEKRRAEEEAARARVERRRLEGLLRTAKTEVEKLTRERDERKAALEEAETKLERAAEAVREVEGRLDGSE